jgi:hypothetical protein
MVSVPQIATKTISRGKRTKTYNVIHVLQGMPAGATEPHFRLPTMNELIFKPRVAPRNGADALITTGVGLLQVLVLIGIPGAIALALWRDLRIALVCMFAINTLFLLMSVTKVVITDEGMRFSRLLGGPRLLAWDVIDVVEEASRKELIVRGWLWPIFPPREFTTSLSSLGHYRIAFRGNVVYFPPKDEAGFMAAVKMHLDKRRAAVA